MQALQDMSAAIRASIARGGPIRGAFAARHAALVRARVRALATVIAVLTIAWIPIDAMGLGATEIPRMALLRLLLAGALLLLVREPMRLSPGMASLLLFWLQAATYAAMQLCLDPAKSNLLRLGYGLFPFVLAAQLAILPLPWGSLFRAALAAPALLLAPVLFASRAIDTGLWNELWLLTLILALAAWASQTQLRLVVDMLGARSDASHDPLTGLANRRSGARRLAADHARALRESLPLSVLMIDLDHFKQVNDRWGHATGDRVLLATAGVLHDELRGADLGVRHGGEEFLVILPGTSSEQARVAAERIREGIAAFSVEVPGTSLRATASIGIATLAEGESPDALIARADAALYGAKSGGRNRCVLAPSPQHEGGGIADTDRQGNSACSRASELGGP